MVEEDKKQIDEAYEKAIETLRHNASKYGFYASNVGKDNYERVWSRDGVIQGLAGIMSEDRELIEVLKQNLKTLKKYQDEETGRIASNIDLENEDVSYGTLVGKIDATLWYVIGIGQYYRYSKDEKFVKEFYRSFEKALKYLEAVELNGSDLLYIPTGGDWADEYITHGYVLFDQILYYLALKEYLNILKVCKKSQNGIYEKIKRLKKMIQVNYFPSEKKKNKKEVYNKGLYSKICDEFNEDYALMFFSSDGFASYMDGFANSLLLLLDIPSREENKKILKSFFKRLNNQKVKIIPAFWPPITSFHYFWKMLKMNSLFEFKNKPHHYHNGGLWPLIQGFYISGLVKQKKELQAKRYLKNFAAVLKEDNYEFHEYFDSKYFKPRGVKEHGFSAAGYVIAYNSVVKNKPVFRG